MPLVDADATMNVAILLFDGVELLDFAGPGEVFSAAECPGLRFNVFTIAADEKPITCQGFVKITPQYTLANCPKPDILIVPGGSTRAVSENPNVIKWIKDKSYNDTKIILSVCTGAFVLAKAGLLNGAEATTWHGALDGLRKAAPKANVLADRRFIDNGDIITAAGVSAGIDASLHIIEMLQGDGLALRTAHAIEYAWKPYRYGSASASSRNPSQQGGDIFEKRLKVLEQDLEAGRMTAASALVDPQLLDLHLNTKFKELVRSHVSESKAVLTAPDEPGIPLVVTGTVQDDKKQPIAGALVHVFHADAAGAYTSGRDMDEPHAQLFAYVKTGADGRYEFRTTHPGGYAGEYKPEPGVALKIPEHIHFEVSAPGFAERKLQLVFKDDPRMTPHWQEWAREQSYPVAAPEYDRAASLQRCNCDITLNRSQP
jgi:transcriptional regulator GlxA family with amidase domain/protocatechuate 3,4-dioxygenase beta subunit